MAIRKQYNALSASFMFLSFATAALLISVQSKSLVANSVPQSQPKATAAVKPHQATATVAQAEQPFEQPQSELLKVGIADILSSSFRPVALIRQSQLVVDLSERQVSLFQDGILQASYDIAVGREGWETPSGEFRVINMQENPAWQNPITGETFAQGTENPLGSRWIGFWTDGMHQIGFHGTNQEESIGQAISHGCIRMRDPDIQALYTQVAVGTPVIVKP
jgi:lipoprotein-anchoring transpeptidase ErfK/SrfK